MAKIMCLYLDDRVRVIPTLINFAIGSDWAACSSTKKMNQSRALPTPIFVNGGRSKSHYTRLIFAQNRKASLGWAFFRLKTFVAS